MVGQADPGEAVNFAEGVHAHLHHRGFVGPFQLQERQGHADEIVQVQPVFQDPEGRGQGGGDHLLGGGLAATAGDAHHRHPEPARQAWARSPRAVRASRMAMTVTSGG